jgi:ABC-type antimicrobial peptide transport system permease subunit
MFLAETLILNTCASLIGMAAAAILLAAGSANGIPLPDIVSQFLIGGGPVPVTITPAPFIIAFAAVIAVSVLATVYPVSVATTITPLKAMNDR